jgi:hypothetical protein
VNIIINRVFRYIKLFVLSPELTLTYWSSNESPMYSKLVFPVEGSVTFASRPQNFRVCCVQAVGLLLYVAPPMCFNDFCRSSQCSNQHIRSNPEISTHRCEDRIAIVVFVGAPAFAVCRVLACRGPVPRTHAALRSVEIPRRQGNGVDVSESEWCENGEDAELFRHLGVVLLRYRRERMCVLSSAMGRILTILIYLLHRIDS